MRGRGGGGGDGCGGGGRRVSRLKPFSTQPLIYLARFLHKNVKQKSLIPWLPSAAIGIQISLYTVYRHCLYVFIYSYMYIYIKYFYLFKVNIMNRVDKGRGGGVRKQRRTEGIKEEEKERTARKKERKR